SNPPSMTGTCLSDRAAAPRRIVARSPDGTVPATSETYPSAPLGAPVGLSVPAAPVSADPPTGGDTTRPPTASGKESGSGSTWRTGPALSEQAVAHPRTSVRSTERTAPVRGITVGRPL